jgi:hypothetical protein
MGRHARLHAGHPRLDSIGRAQDVDGRDKPGHDAMLCPDYAYAERNKSSRSGVRAISFCS